MSSKDASGKVESKSIIIQGRLDDLPVKMLVVKTNLKVESCKVDELEVLRQL